MGKSNQDLKMLVITFLGGILISSGAHFFLLYGQYPTEAQVEKRILSEIAPISKGVLRNEVRLDQITQLNERVASVEAKVDIILDRLKVKK